MKPQVWGTTLDQLTMQQHESSSIELRIGTHLQRASAAPPDFGGHHLMNSEINASPEPASAVVCLDPCSSS